MKERKTAVRLDLKTKFALATFVIKNRNVLISGDKFIYRTNRDVAVIEAKEAGIIDRELPISGTHVTDAVEVFLEIARLTDNMPKVQSSVQEDILVAELKKKDLVIAALNTQLADVKKKVDAISSYFDKKEPHIHLPT